MLGTWICRSYVPLYKILSDMSDEDKAKLRDHMQNIISSLDITDAAMLMAIAAKTENYLYKILVQSLGVYYKEMWYE